MYLNQLNEAFQPVVQSFIDSTSVQKILNGTMTKTEYMGILRQVFHHTRENPQLQTLATTYFRGRQRDSVRGFFNHATSEIGHDQLALNDFVTLGGDASKIPYENPIPATSALLAYGFHQIQVHDPVGYLGYLYFLEFTPTSSGEILLGGLKNCGIPESATTFLFDHSTIDVNHNKLMQKYVEQLIKSRADLDCVVYSMRTTAQLYINMLDDAVLQADQNIDYGWNWEELKADHLTPEGLESELAIA